MFGFQVFSSLKRAFLAPFLTPQIQPASASKRPVCIALPADGELFQLMLDASQADPMAMVHGDGYDPRTWRFNGTPLQGIHTGQFKLVRLGAVSSLVDARTKAHTLGVSLAEGQWREGFKLAYPHNDKGGPIAFGGETTEWVSPNSGRYFPVLSELGELWNSLFFWAGDGFGDNWRWLVREQVK